MTVKVDSVQLFKEARKLLEKPEAWTQRAFARDKLNEPVITSSSFRTAVKWCFAGAISQAAMDSDLAIPCISSLLHDYVGDINIGEWNDDPARTHGEVINLFDSIIADLSQ